MFNARFSLLPAVLAAGFLPLRGEDAPLKKPLITSELGGREMAFLREANEHGVLMNYLAELAKTKGGSKPVTALGELLLSTQAEENSRLVQLAANKGLNYRAQTPASLKELQAKLGGESGEKFDAAVLDALGKQAEAAADNYEKASDVKDADVKNFAVESLRLAKEKQAIIQKIAGLNAGEAAPAPADGQ